MSTDLFASPNINEATPQPNVTPDVNVFADQLSTITNEDGNQKYDTVDKALEALKHSQSFIPTLQSEKTALEAKVAELSEQVAQSKGVQDVMNEIANREKPQPMVDQPVAGMSAEEVASLVSQTLDSRNQADTHKTNATRVDEALKAKFGTEAAKTVALKAIELGTTPEQLGKLAAESPNMVLALFGTEAKQVQGTQSSYNFDTTPHQKERLARPAKSLMFGATGKETTNFMKQIRDEVYADHDIQE
jgi:hypothetical protein